MAPKELDTLAVAREYFEANLGLGSRCPCCDRWGKAYSRPLNSTMVEALMWMVQVSEPGEYIDTANTADRKFVRSNQFSTLKFWGFVEAKANEKGQQASGIWRATPRGRRFVANKARARLRIVTYNDSLLRYDGELVFCKDIVDYFDYDDVVHGPVELEGD